MSRLSEQVTARDNCLLDPTRIRPLSTPSEGRSHTCLSNGKLERNIGECAGSGVLSQSPAERFGVELEFEQPSCVIERLRTERADQTAEVRLHGWCALCTKVFPVHRGDPELLDKFRKIYGLANSDLGTSLRVAGRE